MSWPGWRTTIFVRPPCCLHRSQCGFEGRSRLAFCPIQRRLPRPDFRKLETGIRRAPFDPYPRTNEDEIVRAVRELKSWPVHRPDLDMDKIVELTKLQLWTLKPAQRKEKD